MGMYDNVTYAAPCPICGQTMAAFQSKDADCQLDRLTPAELWGRSEDTRNGRSRGNGYSVRGYCEFYMNCRGCETWVEIHFSRPAGEA